MASEVERDDVSEPESRPSLREGTDLSWPAFRYVAGEMACDEVEAFERRLDEDQGAREAVAQAVELAGAIAALPPDADGSLPFRRRPAVRTFLAVTSMAAAACLAWLALS